MGNKLYCSSFRSKVHDNVMVIVREGDEPQDLRIQALDDLAPYDFWQDYDLDPDELRFGIDVDEVIQAINQQGYFIRVLPRPPLKQRQ